MDRLGKYIALPFLLFLIPSGEGAKVQYAATLKNLTNCAAPDLPYAAYSPFDIHFEIYNGTRGTNLLKGNLTIKEKINQDDKKASFKCGIESPEGLKWRLTTKDLGCKSLVVKSVFGAFGIPYVSKCTIKKGVYYLKNIDVAKADRAFLLPARTFGSWICVFAIYDAKHTLGCWNAYVQVSPVKAYRYLN